MGKDISTLERADELLVAARTDPEEALERAQEVLTAADAAGDQLAQARSLRAIGVANRELRRIGVAISSLEDAYSYAAGIGLDDEAALAAVTLSSAHYIAGDTPAAVAALDQADELAEGDTAAVAALQRANILYRSGQFEPAITAFDGAFAWFQELDDLPRVARILINRGRAYLFTGALDAAERDLRYGRQLFEELGLSYQVPYVDYSLATVELYRGNLVESLRLFQSSEDGIHKVGGNVVETQAGHCEALLSAGLWDEAQRRALAAAKRMADLDLASDRVEVLLVAGHAARLRGDAVEAERASREAIGLLAAQDRPGWLAAARHLNFQARCESLPASRDLLEEAITLGRELSGSGPSIPMSDLRLSITRLSIALGELDTAREAAAQLATDAGPVELRFSAWLGRALLAHAAGNRRAVSSAARAGIRLLDAYQQATASSDVRFGLASHAAELSGLALRVALSGGDPRRSFEWMERTRARSLARPPVKASADPRVSEELRKIRRLSEEARTASPADLPRILRQTTQSQNRIRRLGRLALAAGIAGSEITAPRAMDLIGNGAAIEFAETGGTIWGVQLHAGRAQLESLGDAQPSLRSSTGMGAAMRRAATDPQNRSTWLDRVGIAGADLEEALLAKLPPTVGHLTISPPAELHAVPWGMLPSLQDRPFSITPSMTLLLRGAAHRGSRHVVGVAGPGLPYAAKEVREVSAIHDRSMAFAPRQSHTAAVLEAIDGAALAHFACHGTFNPEQPMFSTLSLADGDLNLYDLSDLENPPSIMVLAACEAGLSKQGAGEELIGTVGTLLSMGTRAVIASVGPLPDSSATVRLMVILHEALRDGSTVAEALLEVRRAAKSPVAKVIAYSLLCFGYGEARLRE